MFPTVQLRPSAQSDIFPADVGMGELAARTGRSEAVATRAVQLLGVNR